MNINYAFTYIIGYRHIPDRLNNLRRTLDWVNAFTNVQVLLIEQDKHSKLEGINLPCRHIFVKNNKPYNRSWAFNVGLKYVKSNLVVFGDSDIIMDPNDFIAALKETSEYDMVSPYSSVLDLNPEESKMSLREIVKITRPGRGETDNQKINIAGGISIFRKDAINKVGGWPEEFVGWGGEDDFQAIKIKKLLKWKEMSAKCYHLYHAKSPIHNDYYANNLNLLQKFNQMKLEELNNYILNVNSRIGSSNKYEFS